MIKCSSTCILGKTKFLDVFVHFSFEEKYVKFNLETNPAPQNASIQIGKVK